MDLRRLNEEIVACTRCPRLVQFREEVARKKRRMYMDWNYWGRPVPGFGDASARVLILGLAPAAHGANRTGRMFTGDRSADWLLAAMCRYGFSNRPSSRSRDDGLALTDAYITAVLRCAPPANKPVAEELANCRPYLLAELDILSNVQVVLALGKVAFDGFLAACPDLSGSPRPKFGHCVVYPLPSGLTLVGSYHPSQQNTQTGRLTREMFDSVFERVRRLLEA
ncbi:MAG: uracil-DNA glycosylase [Chloroflexi bacterium]|nr:uracil-DNA glycosylase [Chloroflexota bacterium]